jgi:hypothetical protein
MPVMQHRDGLIFDDRNPIPGARLRRHDLFNVRIVSVALAAFCRRVTPAASIDPLYGITKRFRNEQP